MYTMVSDIWNGWAGDGGFSECTNGEPHWGNKCKFSVSNIRMKGVPFTGKCTALSGWPVPAGVQVSISAAQDVPLCLDLKDNVEAKGTSVQAWGCDKDQPDTAQRWIFRDGQIIHRSVSGEEFCLDIPGNERRNGIALQLWKCKGSPQQQFMYQDGAIKTIDGSKCLDLKSEDMQTLHLWDCFPGTASQQWSVTEVSVPADAAVVVSSYRNSACFHLNKVADGAKLHASSCDALAGTGADQWLFRDGSLVLAHSGADHCLDIPENDLSNGIRLQIWSCNGSPQQQFRYQGGMITTEDGSKCVDLRAENEKAVQIWDCDMLQPNQQWILTAVASSILV